MNAVIRLVNKPISKTDSVSWNLSPEFKSKTKKTKPRARGSKKQDKGDSRASTYESNFLRCSC